MTDALNEHWGNPSALYSFGIDTAGMLRSGDDKQTDFINCVAWKNTAEFISKYFGKGRMIAVTGRLQSRSYEDKNGNKRTAIEVNVEQASFTGEPKKSEEPTEEFPF